MYSKIIPPIDLSWKTLSFESLHHIFCISLYGIIHDFGNIYNMQTNSYIDI